MAHGHPGPSIELDQPDSYAASPFTQYWQATDQQQELADVMQLGAAQWSASSSDNINLGFSNTPYWYRLHVINHSQYKWYLRINYPPTDYYDVYLCPSTASEPSLCHSQHQGELLPFEQRERYNPNFIFPLVMDANDYIIYVRAQSTGSYQFPAFIQEESQLNKSLSINNFLRGAYFTMMLVMMLYNFFIFTMTRSRTYLLYSSYVLSFLLFHMTYEGSAFQFLWPNTPQLNEHALTVAFSINQFFMVVFTAAFLNLKHFSQTSYNYFRILAAISITGLAASPFASYQTLLPLLNLFSVVISFSSLYLGVSYWIKGRSAARFFTIAWAVFLAGFVTANLRTLGIVPSNFFTLYGYQIGSFIEIVLLSLALGERIQRLQQEKASARRELLDTKQQAINTLKSYEDLYYNSVSGQFQLDQGLHIHKTNPSFRHLIGFEDEEQFNERKLSLYDLVKNHSDVEKLREKLEWQQKVKAYELPMTQRNGNQVVVSLTISKNDNLSLPGYSASAIDITDKIQHAELQRKAQADRMASLKQLIVGVSHEMNTPIGNIALSKSFLSELIDEIKQQTQQRNLTPAGLSEILDQQETTLNMVGSACDELGELTKVFKSISIDRNEYPQQSIDIRAFLTDWIDSLEDLAPVELEMKEDIECDCYPTAMRIILQQLWNNSIEHNNRAIMAHKLAIKITVTAQDNFVQIIFADNGIGLSEEECQQMFLPFYTKARGEKKLGLGMYQIYNLVTDLYQGKIHARPGEDQGLTIKLRIPRHGVADF